MGDDILKENKIYNIGNLNQKISYVRLQVYCIKPTRIMIDKVLRIWELTLKTNDCKI